MATQALHPMQALDTTGFLSAAATLATFAGSMEVMVFGSERIIKTKNDFSFAYCMEFTNIRKKKESLVSHFLANFLKNTGIFHGYPGLYTM